MNEKNKAFEDRYYTEMASRIKSELSGGLNTKTSSIDVKFIKNFCMEWDRLTRAIREKCEGTDVLSNIQIKVSVE